MLHSHILTGTMIYSTYVVGKWKLNNNIVLPKNTTQCPRPGLEPGPLDPETSALTMRPPRLPQKKPSEQLLLLI